MSDREPRVEAPRPQGPDELPAPPRLRDYTKLPLLIVAAMFVAGAVLYPSLPARFPTHWGISGAPDAFSDKTFMSVFFEPLIALGIYALLDRRPVPGPEAAQSEAVRSAPTTS